MPCLLLWRAASAISCVWLLLRISIRVLLPAQLNPFGSGKNLSGIDQGAAAERGRCDVVPSSAAAAGSAAAPLASYRCETFDRVVAWCLAFMIGLLVEQPGATAGDGAACCYCCW
jgi:hypothetical protein